MLRGIFSILCQTFHGTRQKGISSRSTQTCIEWQLGQSEINSYEGFPHNWCKPLWFIGSTPFDLHWRHIGSVSRIPKSIPSRVMCCSSMAIIMAYYREVLPHNAPTGQGSGQQGSINCFQENTIQPGSHRLWHREYVVWKLKKEQL